MRTFIERMFDSKSVRNSRKRADRSVRLHPEMMEDRRLFAIGAEAIAPLNTAQHEYESANASSFNGTHAVVWTVKNTVTGEKDIMGRIFNSAGAPLTPDFVVNNQVGRDDSDPTVAMDSNGNLWVAWERNNGGTRDILATKIDQTGANLLGPMNTFITVAGSARDEFDPSIGCNRFGDFVVSFTVAMGGGNTDVYQARFNAAGAALGTSAVAATARPEGFSSLSRNMLGDYVIAWQFDGVATSGAPNSNIQARKYNNAGAAVTGVLAIANAATRMETAPTVSIDQAGASTFAWESGPSGGTRDILARRMSAANVLAANFTISATAANETRPWIALTPSSGQFAIVYESTAGGVTSSFVKEYSAANVNVLTLNMGANRNMPVVSVGPNHQYIVTYTNLIGVAGDPNLGVRRRHGVI